MSADFANLLVAAAASAWGTWAALKGGAHGAAKAGAVLLYLLVGMQTVLFAALTGDGRVVPGFQLNPEFNRLWRDAIGRGALPSPDAAYCLVAVLAHLLAGLPRPGPRGLLRPLPATLAFAVLFFVLQDRAEGPLYRHERGTGPERAAWLTIAPKGNGVRLVLSEGRGEAPLLRVRLVHDAESAPPEPKLFWTKDGKGVVVAVRGRRLLAVDVESGAVTGALPSETGAWPSEVPAAEPVSARIRFSQAQRDVAEFVVSHGGLHVE